jgi:D-alanyl-lipoteichoic acid acyltransferase DltB (MBOAT superfamily)
LGKLGIVLALLLNFILVGFWHGPNWTYIFYGFLHGCYFIPLVLGKGITKVKFNNKVFPSFIEFAKMLGTFSLVMFSLLIFKASSLTQAVSYFSHFFSSSIFQIPIVFNVQSSLVVISFCMIVLLVEWVQRNKDHALQFSSISYHYHFYFRSLVVTVVFWAIVIWGASGNKTFMYFKF